VRRSARRILAVLPPILAALGLAPTVAAAGAASPVQQEILALFFTILIFALIIGVLVHVLILAAVRWYRDSPQWRPPKGHPRTHDRRLEVGWTIGPALILAGVVVITLFALQTIERPTRYDYAIDVYGAQWAWRFKYPVYTFPNGTWNVSVPDSSGTMYIQQGLTFLLQVHSDDVIHAFYVPDLGIKIDVVPGRTNIFWVQATIPGTYTVQCAEFCGVGHSQMHGEVVVFPPGAQAIPYGPPPGSVPSGFDAPKHTIVDVAFKESPGTCEPSKQWSIEPCRISLGSNFNVTLRVWNNETAIHQFEISSPISLLGPVQEAKTGRPLYFNFNTGAPGQYTFWCNISGHKPLGMEGLLNVTGPQIVDVTIHDNSIDPAEIIASLGTTMNFRIQNAGSVAHSFAIDPPYNTIPLSIPVGGSDQMTVVLNRTTSGVLYGGGPPERSAGIVGTLRVLSAIQGPPPPPPPAGFPVVQVTFGLTGLAAAAAVAFNFKLGRDARRRRQFPPEEV